MKIQKFKEAKQICKICGEFPLQVNVNVLFKINKTLDGNGYSLRAKIDGYEVYATNSWVNLGLNLEESQIEPLKLEYLSRFSIIHKESKKYNL